MSICLYKRYWFWNKFTGEPDEIYVSDISDGRVFLMHGDRHLSCPLAYAEEHLYDKREQLPNIKKYDYEKKREERIRRNARYSDDWLKRPDCPEWARKEFGEYIPQAGDSCRRRKKNGSSQQ